MKTSCAALLWIVLAFARLMADDAAPPSPSDYHAIYQHFFDVIKTEDFGQAARFLVDTHQGNISNIPLHENVARALEGLRKNGGAFKRFEPLVDKTIGTSIAYIYGFGFYANGPVRFELVFYKDDDRWQFLNINYSSSTDRYVPELRDMAGVHFAPESNFSSVPPPPPQKSIPAGLAAPTRPSFNPVPAPQSPPAKNP